MKKILSIVLCAAFMLGMSGCDKKAEEIPPTNVTSMFLDAYLAKDSKKIKQYSQWDEDAIKALSMQKEDYLTDVDKTLQDEVHAIMFQFDHKEQKEKIEEDKASVTTELTLYDFAPALKKGMEQATKKVEELSKKSNISDAQAQQEIITVLFKNIKQAKKRNKVIVTINLMKNDDDQWIVTNDNDQLQEALLKNAKSLEDVNK